MSAVSSVIVISGSGHIYTYGYARANQCMQYNTMVPKLFGEPVLIIIRESGIVIVHDPIIPPELAYSANVRSVTGHNCLGHLPGGHIYTVGCAIAN